MVRPARSLLAAALLAALAGCARSDLGGPCHLQNAAGAELRPQPGREYLYLGSSECESFSCIATPGTVSAYCSQACSGPGSSCPGGLVCAQIALDQSYLDFMRNTLPPDRFQAQFGQLSSSYYCVKGN